MSAAERAARWARGYARGIARSRPGQLLMGSLEACASIGFIAFAYLGPLVLLYLYNALDVSFFVAEPRAERTAEYMASMSWIPFPDASEEVLEVTEELMSPPGQPRPAHEEPVGTETPLKPNAEKGTIEANTGKPKATEGSEEEVVRSGGEVKGPTQDGEGSTAQDCLPDNPDIVSLGNNKWSVKQDLVDHYVNHLGEAEKLADVFWQKGKGGEIIGFRVRRVRCGNDLYQLGFRGNDVVTAVNGEPVTSVPQVIGAYLKLRRKDKLRVALRRNKKEMVFVYTLE